MPCYRITRRTFLKAASAGAAALAVRGAGDAAEPVSPFQLTEQEGGRLLVSDACRPVLEYRFGDQLAPGVPEKYRRACYCHPVYAPDGTVLTDDFPKDHYHHRGIFWAWPIMKIRGKAVQTWHLEGLHQRHVRWNSRTAGPASAVLDVSNAWVMDDGTHVGTERVRITVHRAAGAGRAIDFRLTFEAEGGPIELLGAKGKGYGGFSMRFAPRKSTVITTEAGVQKKDSNDGSFAWADLSARFKGAARPVGAAIFTHPRIGPRPRGWTIRHYGLLGPSWPGLEPSTLQPGAPVTLAYRVYVHRGGAEEAKVAQAYAAYASAAPAPKGVSG